MEKILLRQRVSRAYKDTSGFEKWRRNIVLAALASIISFVLEWYVLKKKDIILEYVIPTTITFVTVFLLVPVLEFLWNLPSAGERILKGEITRLESENTDLQGRLSNFSRTDERTVRDDWEKLADRFSVLNSDIRADWTRGEGEETWRIAGFRTNDSRNCKGLCEYAGKLLLSSPRIERLLSNKIRSRADDGDRWLDFVKEREGVEDIIYGEVRNSDKDSTHMFLHGSIKSLPDACCRACLYCSMVEIGSQ